MKIEYIKGDLLESDCHIIGHQVNCLGRMGSGIAAQIKKKWPKVYHEYTDFCVGDWDDGLLGKCQICMTGYNISPTYLPCFVANIFGQFEYGTDRRHTDYDALKSGLIILFDFAQFFTSKERPMIVGLPKIGCGLAGGDWNVVEEMILGIIKERGYDFILRVYEL